MIVVESGGTKSTWIYRNKLGEKVAHVTVGLHPQEITESKKAKIEEFLIEADLHGSEVYFYGAGCESQSGRKVINDLLESAGLKVNVIASDVVCACLAIHGNTPGVAGILGTGAVVAQYDGQKVTQMASGRGYILGDEGSGFDIGRHVTVALLDGRLKHNHDLEQAIIEHFGDEEKIVHTCSGSDSRFKIAALCEKIAIYRNDREIKKILVERFNAFIDRGVNLLSHQNKIGMIGSIAFHFSEELSNVLNSRDIELIKVFKEAADATFDFIDKKK
tara:strand:+ start:58548 stop:59372 length:825 start_codon:yes stop_codon:yes gene_type:complete